MRASKEFTGRGHSFWSCVRALSQGLGYSQGGSVTTPMKEEIVQKAEAFGISRSHLWVGSELSPLVNDLYNYFAYRADVLNNFVSHQLLVLEEIRELFAVYEHSAFACELPRNKQKGDKAGYAYFTCLIHKLIAQHADGHSIAFSPKTLLTVMEDGLPVGTLSRHVDGCFPSTINPIAVWEIKEYYHSTSFGSRVADAIYESLLDGIELQQIRSLTGKKIEHVLMLDARNTWWDKGKPYLCRVIDMLHMGYVDEVLFGREVVERIPILVKSWIAQQSLVSKQ